MSNELKEEKVDVLSEDENGRKTTQEEGQFSKPSQIITLFCLFFTDLCITLAYSMIVPFFPIVSQQKGAHKFEVGIILGIYQGIMLIFCPLFGYHMMKIGTKFMFVSGTFFTGGCVILFGLLEWSPDGRVFVIMSLVVRCFKGIGAAAIDTAVFTIISDKYSSRLSTIIGCFYAIGSMGVMGGPPLGGFLYEFGGYHMPFTIVGSLFLVTGIISWIAVPPSSKAIQPSVRTHRVSRFGLLKIPMVWLSGSVVMLCWADMGFIDSGLAEHLQQYGLSTVKIGLMFLVPCLSVLIMSPMFGFIADSYPKYAKIILILGPIIGGSGLTLVGPTQLLSFIPNDQLWVVAVGLGIGGIAIATISYSYQCMINAAIASGWDNTTGNKALIAGVYASYRYFGSCFGPILGGFMMESISFMWVTTIYGILTTFPGIGIFIYTIASKHIGEKKKEPTDIKSNPSEIDAILP